MTEPDFEQIAESIVPPSYVGFVAEQLRLVWNARGAADIAKVDAMLYADGTSRTGLDKMLDQALRSLDR